MLFTGLLSCRSQVCSSYTPAQARESFTISRLCHSPLSVPKVLFYSLQWLRECLNSSANLWCRVVESHGFSVLQKMVEWSYYCPELPLQCSYGFMCYPPPTRWIPGNHEKCPWPDILVCQGAVPGEPFPVMIPWWQAGHKVIEDDMNDASSIGEQGQLPWWMTKAGTFYFFFSVRDHLLIPHLCRITDESFICSRHPAKLSFFAGGDLKTSWIVVSLLASGTLQ